VVVDASVWVSEVVIADAHHARSAVWLERQMASGTALVVPILALSEVAGAVARRSGDAGFGLRAFERLQAFPVLSIVDMDQSLGVAAAEVAATLGRACRW
jgi:predicted nucleic acid-binding protein